MRMAGSLSSINPLIYFSTAPSASPAPSFSKMFSFAKIAFFAVVSLGMVGVTAAAPVHNATELVSRGPYDTHNGWATSYSPSARTKACGWNNRDDEWVAAIGTGLFQQMMIDGNPNHSQACGKTATATWSGKPITVGIVDRCYVCGTEDINLTPSTFQ